MTSSPNLKGLLEKFNRKERNWLVRDALGAACERLDKGFLDKAAAAVRHANKNFVFDEVPYWTTDFHIDWLVGVLHQLKHPEGIGRIHPNDRSMIKGSQQDIDLVIATGNTLLLIEAKGEGGWSNRQISQKIERLKSMMPELIDQEGFSGGVRIMFILCSPRPAPPKLSVADWPAWALVGGRPLHFELRRPLTEFFAVSRCDEAGPNKAATHWMVRTVPYGSAQDEPIMVKS